MHECGSKKLSGLVAVIGLKIVERYFTYCNIVFESFFSAWKTVEVVEKGTQLDLRGEAQLKRHEKIDISMLPFFWVCSFVYFISFKNVRKISYDTAETSMAKFKQKLFSGKKIYEN